jgi:hypothetical protein
MTSKRMATVAVAALALVGPGHAEATLLPAGTRLAVRLDTPVSSRRSHPGDVVQATLIAPIRIGSEIVLSAGSTVTGNVVEVGHLNKPPRAVIRLAFSMLVTGEVRVPIDARMTDVDNARETVDAEGRIVGPAHHRFRPGVVEAGLWLAHANPLVAVLLEAGRIAQASARRTSIDFAGGTDATLELTTPAEIDGAPETPDREMVLPEELAAIAHAQPGRVGTGAPRRPADVTNLLFIGSADEARAAFEAAGWTRPDRPSLRTDAKLLWAFAERRTYRSAPVSRLDLDGRPPDLVFERQANTITQRHHVRLWKQPGSWGGRSIFVAAASHDVGIFFSRSGLRFTHHIDPWIDVERDKIIDDLAFVGRVAGQAFVDRPGLPTRCRNAAGDRISTDARMGVVVLRPFAVP